MTHEFQASEASAPRRGRLLLLPIPLVMGLLAFTAIPTELRMPSRWLARTILATDFDGADAVVNTLGYVPLGAVLAGRRALTAIGFGTIVSIVAETAQLFSTGRSPSLIDVATNVVGTAIGFALCRLLRITPVSIRIGTRLGRVAAAMAIAYAGFGGSITPADLEDAAAVFITAPPWLPANDRGATSPGRLEAHWTFDTIDNGVTADASSNGLSGTVMNSPTLVTGVHGSAIRLNGKNQWVGIGEPLALRLVGSMTISAWINPAAFPNNDAAIVSTFNTRSRGYQLDATTDEGPPAIGFKLTNGLGQEIARYGRSRLPLNRWSHIAGVYDATARTLNVYLNGRLDNGCLHGPVTDRQHISGVPVFVGRRWRYRAEEFSGDLDDVKIYSRALTNAEIAMEAGATPAGHFVADADGESHCRESRQTDPRVPGLAMALGMLVAVGAAGLWRGPRFRSVAIVCSLAAGLILVGSMASVAPPLFLWVVPLLTLAGGCGVAFSVRP